ncbi:MAG: thermonuclease family protein [Nitrospirota bacterium]
MDGDTIEVLQTQHPEPTRLSGINCLEKGQTFGKNAQHAMSAPVFGKEVTLEAFGKDDYHRALAEASLPNGTNVNHELVKDDRCWWCPKYAPADTELEKLETDARFGQRGL